MYVFAILYRARVTNTDVWLFWRATSNARCSPVKQKLRAASSAAVP